SYFGCHSLSAKGRSTKGTPLRSYCNFGETLGAFLCRWIRRRFASPHSRQESVHWKYHKNVDSRCYKQERQQRVDEVSDRKLAAVDFEHNSRKVGFTDYCSDKRSNQIFHQCRHNCTKSSAHHYCYGEVQDVPAKQELFKAFHELPSFEIIEASARRMLCT